MKLFYTLILITSLGCQANRNPLANTKWLVKALSVDSLNSLSEAQRNIISPFDSSTKMHMHLTNTFAITYVEGKVPDTCRYIINDDTVFYFYENNKTDTNIILKLTRDSFKSVSLSGIRQSSIKEK